ncbi:protein panoramix [Drosophila hydei]|uniref:Protein panoramix n=1 Tax=Drosophila hydei TaxID=7224 RepID=A0A6J1LAV0_DROHY|nr:protein panoramix [Drosophila hydei]
MEDVTRIKNEADADYSNLKCEESPSKDDEDACTPLREEGEQSAIDPAAISPMGAAGWESEVDDQDELLPAPPPPSLECEVDIKRSPQNDYCQTPLRVSTTDEPQSESEQNAHLSDAQNDYVGDLMALVAPKEERKELQLGFLDVLSETDFAGVTNGSYSQMNQLDTMDLEPPNIINSEEERELQARIEQRQKELDQLKRTTTEKRRKKHKKEKKHDSHKKRKRSRSISPSSQKSRKERRLLESDRASGSRISSKSIVKPEPEELDFVPVRPEEKSIKVININKLMQRATEPTTQRTVQERRQLGLERAQSVLNLMRLKAAKAPETEFLVVNTIKKLPSLAAYMKSDIFENPSPLCNNFNVRYKFNSTSASNINLNKWGLEPLPDATRALLRLTGIDAMRLMELQRNTKMSLHKLRSTQQAENGKCSREEDDSLSTGLYKSVSTQTDARITNQSRDVGVQAMPASYQGVYWLNPRFDDTDLTQQQTNVMLALKELSASSPSSTCWADRLFRELRTALAIKRAEVKELSQH